MPFQRGPHFVNSIVVLPLNEIHPCFGKPDLRCIVAIRACLIRCGNSPVDPLLVPLVEVVILSANVRQPGVSERKIRIECDRALVHLQRKLQVLPCDAAGIISPSQIEIVGLQVFGRFRGEGLLFLRRERDPEGGRDL